jgi:uncharacterized membrane protein YbhN (UPF0104 family)
MGAPADPAAPEPKPSARRWLSLALRVGIAVALIAWLVRSGAIEWRALAGLAHEWPLTLAALGVLALSTWITAIRLPVLLRPMGFRLGAWPAVVLMTTGLFFGLFLPGGAGGDIAKVYYSVSGHRRGTRTELATAVLLDRAIGMWAMFAMPLLALPFFAGVLAGASGVATLVRFSAWVFAAGGALLAGVLWMPERWAALPGRVAGDFVARGVATVRFFRAHPGALARSFALSIAAHTTAVLTTWFLAGAIHPQSQRAELGLVVPLGFVANALPLTPGGIGVGETAFHRLFHFVGLDGGAEVAIGWRLAVTLVALVGGLLYVTRGRRPFITPVSAEAES